MSSKSYWLRIAGGVLALAAIIGLWFGDEYYTEKEAEEKKLAEKAIPFEADQVREVELSIPSSGVKLAFSRVDAKSDWRMLAPTDAIAADQDAVNNFVSALGDMRRERELKDFEASKAAEFGLDKPRRMVTLKLAPSEGSQEPKVVGLEIGGDVQVGKAQGSDFKALSVYARPVGTQNLLVIPSSTLAATDKTFADFRTKKVAKFKRDDIGQFAFDSANGAVTAQKKDGSWNLTLAGGRSYAGDSNAIGLFIDRFERLRADSVLESSDLGASGLADLGLASPRVTIAFKKDDGSLIQSIAIGLNDKNVHLTMADGAIAKLALDQYAELAPELKNLRDLRVMTGLDFAKVQRLVTSKGRTFQREGQRWFLVGPQPADTAAAGDKASAGAGKDDQENRAEAATLVSDFEFMRANDIIDPESVQGLGEYGLEQPIEKLTLEFTGEASPQKIEVKLGRRVASDEKKIYLKRDGSEAVFIVDTGWMDSLKALDDPARDKVASDKAGDTTPQAKKGDSSTP